jgi:hypothetical protein
VTVAAVDAIIGARTSERGQRRGRAADGGGVRILLGGPTALPRQPARASYNPAFLDGKNMEAERLNQIEGTIADLRGRLAELRRYL